MSIFTQKWKEESRLSDGFIEIETDLKWSIQTLLLSLTNFKLQSKRVSNYNLFITKHIFY